VTRSNQDIDFLRAEMSESEVRRYVGYLQQSLASNVLPEAHDQGILAQWVMNNRHRLQEIASNYPVSVSDEDIDTHVSDIITYQPDTDFQAAYSARIFEPLIEEVSALAAELGIGLSRPIIVANLPDVGIGPLSRPSIETPMIFAGLGTSTFCNYWAKFYCTFFAGLTGNGANNGARQSARQALEHMQTLVTNAVKLSLYYAHTGTVLGFGRIQEPMPAFGHRMELLRAMEVFVLAHEFAHLFLEEKNPELQGSCNPDTIRKLEFQCDEIGFALCRNYGAKTNNWSAFCGAGAFLFFEAVKTCYFARGLLPIQASEGDGHPSPSERQHRLFEFAVESANDDQKEAVAYYMKDLQSNSALSSSVVCSLIKSAFTPDA
jgi:hypothetical protein